MIRTSWLAIAATACGGGNLGPDATPIAAGPASVLELHGSPSRAGAYIEPALTTAAAATLHLDPSFTATYAGTTFAQPLYLDRGGPRDLLIVATETNEVSAFDPTGAVVWQTALGAPQQMPNPAEGAGCGDVNPLGITGTPVIDPETSFVFLDAMVRVNDAARHRIFSLGSEDGAIRPGWPVDVESALVSQAFAFHSAPQNQRGGLTLAGGRVYVPYGGHAGDCGDYRGWVVAVESRHPGRITAFVTHSKLAGAWTPGGLTSDGASVFGVFGNGEGGDTWAQSEAVIRLGSGATFSGDARDYWSPTNWPELDRGDVDLTGPAMPLDLPGATPDKLLVSFGKDGNVYLHARDNLGGIADPVAQLHAADSAILNTPALYHAASGTYVAFRGLGTSGCPGRPDGSNLVAVKITPGAPPQLSLAWCAGSGNTGSPIATTSDGTADAIVWTIGAEGDQRLHGYDAESGAVVFDGGGPDDALESTSRFITPIVARGRIFVAGNGRLYAFKPR